jgi:hypothetical protein
MGVVVDTELIGDGQQERVGFCDGFVFRELPDKDVRLGGVAAAEDGLGVVAEEADLVLVLTAAPEIGAVALVDQREDAAADRHPRRARVSGRLPSRAEDPDLLRLLDVKRASALVDLECRALQVHPELGGPLSGGVRGGAPPDSFAQALRVGLDAQEAGWIRKHRPWVRTREAVSAQHLQKDFGVVPGHVGVGLSLGRDVTEVAPAVDHLLG